MLTISKTQSFLFFLWRINASAVSISSIFLIGHYFALSEAFVPAMVRTQTQQQQRQRPSILFFNPLGEEKGSSKFLQTTQESRSFSLLSMSAQDENESLLNDEHVDPSLQNNNNYNRRRHLLQLAGATTTAFGTWSTNIAAALATGISSTTTTTLAYSEKLLVPSPAFDKDLYWPLGKIAFSLLPLAGSERRATIEECVIPDRMWTHDQIQGVFNINVPVRQTVIQLSKESGGGLWVHNPVAPTPQLLKMMSRLEEKYGPVRHIVLGTVALEHKATFVDFVRKFPKAKVWVQPGQWSFPVSLPFQLLGVPQRFDQGTLRRLPPPSATKLPEWTADIEYEILGPFVFNSVGAFSETAFFHKSTETLIVTDTVLSISSDPPPIIEQDPRPLLFFARDYATDPTLIEQSYDTNTMKQLKRKGWRRMVQLGLIFFPSQIEEVSSLPKSFEDAIKNLPPEYANLGQGAVPLRVYPFNWYPNDADIKNFNTLTRNGKLFCPPILTKLILNREPVATFEWVDKVSTRFSNMKRIIPGHLNNNLSVTSSREFNAAFDTLRLECCPESKRSSYIGSDEAATLEQDLSFLQTVSEDLTKLKIVSPPVEISCGE